MALNNSWQRVAEVGNLLQTKPLKTWSEADVLSLKILYRTCKKFVDYYEYNKLHEHLK